MEILDWHDLRLTIEESAGIIRLRAKARQSKETISLLHGVTDGWVAGLILMLESAREKSTGPRRLGEALPKRSLSILPVKYLIGRTGTSRISC
jgi:ATP/maltotriose-dependent transcriptional regulator MalT